MDEQAELGEQAEREGGGNRREARLTQQRAAR
jgi:hypothetical protein